jgi:hypothetical protein
MLLVGDLNPTRWVRLTYIALSGRRKKIVSVSTKQKFHEYITIPLTKKTVKVM